jgi:hypothetical protein
MFIYLYDLLITINTKQMSNLIYNLLELNYKNDVIIPTLLNYGSWTLNDEVRYYYSTLLGTYKVIYKTIGNDEIINFANIDEMANDINNNLYK